MEPHATHDAKLHVKLELPQYPISEPLTPTQRKGSSKRIRSARTKEKTRSLERSSSGTDLLILDTEIDAETQLKRMGSSGSRIRLPFKAKRKPSMNISAENFVPIVCTIKNENNKINNKILY